MRLDLERDFLITPLFFDSYVQRFIKVKAGTPDFIGKTYQSLLFYTAFFQRLENRGTHEDHELYAHITLEKGERSELANLANDLL